MAPLIPNLGDVGFVTALDPEWWFRVSPNIPLRRRALNILALLLLVLLPLQGSIQGAPSAAADTSRAARTAKVFMKFEKQQVTAKQRAHVKIALSARSARSQAQGALLKASLGTGKVKVVIVGKSGKPKGVGAKLVKGKAVVRLPKLKPGTYKVRANFLGNALLGKAKSRIRTLRVVGVGGTGAAGCASTGTYVPDGSDGRGGCFPGPANTGPNAPASRWRPTRVPADHHGEHRDRLQGCQLPGLTVAAGGPASCSRTRT